MPPRRDAGRARGKPIEQAILAATLDELAEHGLDALSVNRIAEASAVNKTTIYRRWPSKELLVAAALEGALRESAAELRDTGSLRGDLQVMLHVVGERMSSAAGRALVLAAIANSSGTAVAELANDPKVRGQAPAVALVERATARGEWDPQRHSPDAVLALVTGAVMHRVLLERLPISAAWAETVVDVIVGGVAPR